MKMELNNPSPSPKHLHVEHRTVANEQYSIEPVFQSMTLSTSVNLYNDQLVRILIFIKDVYQGFRVVYG